MALQLRKLMSESFAEAVSELCNPYCDDSNQSATCPPSCFSICPDYCNTSLYPPSYNDYDPPDPPPAETHLTLTWVVLIAVSAAVAIIVVAALFLKTRQRMRRRRNQGHQPPPPEEEQTLDREFLDQDRGPVVEHHIWYINTVGLQQSVIDSIAVCKYKTGEGLVDGTECSVCLSEFEEDETLRLLPKCSHAFHIPCIDTWLRSHTNCPMCRAPIVRSNASTPPAGGSTIPDPITGEEELVGSDGRVQSGGEDEQGSGAEEEGELEAGNRAKDETQPIRRSVSLDSLSASKISLDVARTFPEEIDGNSSTQMMNLRNGTGENRVVEEQKLMKLVMAGSSVQRSFRRGSSSSLMRSLSCSGRLFLSTHSRSRSSVLPL